MRVRGKLIVCSPPNNTNTLDSLLVQDELFGNPSAKRSRTMLCSTPYAQSHHANTKKNTSYHCWAVVLATTRKNGAPWHQRPDSSIPITRYQGIQATTNYKMPVSWKTSRPLRQSSWLPLWGGGTESNDHASSFDRRNIHTWSQLLFDFQSFQ